MVREVNDVVLIYYEEQPSVFARIEGIEPDIKRGWFQVTLLLLTLPTQVVTWILRDEYIDGTPFTMGGKGIRLEAVERVDVGAESPVADQVEDKDRDKTGKVIPFKKK